VCIINSNIWNLPGPHEFYLLLGCDALLQVWAVDKDAHAPENHWHLSRVQNVEKRSTWIQMFKYRLLKYSSTVRAQRQSFC
jgi:hypothetical protein